MPLNINNATTTNIKKCIQRIDLPYNLELISNKFLSYKPLDFLGFSKLKNGRIPSSSMIAVSHINIAVKILNPCNAKLNDNISTIQPRYRKVSEVFLSKIDGEHHV